MSKQSKHDRAWQQVFERTSLLSQLETTGYAYISAHELKTFGQREPRLMAKQDTLHSRPAIFRQHQLAILPVENGQYVIFRDRAHKSYFNLTSVLDDMPKELYTSAHDLYSFDTYPSNQRLSESQAIDFSYVSLLLHTFLKEEQLHLTLRGRLRSGNFHFTLPDSQANINVSGVQIEVDSGYESHKKIYLIEAKVGKRDDFHIRQLFYPYLEWSQRSRKEIVPIFLIYSNAQYYLLQFRLSRIFGELTITKKACYSVNESPRAAISFSQLLHEIPVDESEPSIPYPQADDLDKVVDCVQLLAGGMHTKADIAEYFDFDERQGDYYLNAATYLGYLERTGREFTVTALGQHFTETRSRTERTESLVIQLIKKPTFRDVFQRMFTEETSHLRLFKDYVAANELDKYKLGRTIQAHTSLNEGTALRRALTMKAWIGWVLKNCEY
ncbi:hypothetical protein CSA56_01330 [candidate division KSB3 bacterium]|uniref:Translation elongation factor n=1 Tax=candidate division KSB3 bacterium TaxID=2044937 RepID=A0A2G6KL87_9BACT|nr:MAG: hypothetical protein CSA56_01330 [candidate division KSB3 bacterium]